MTEHPVAPSLAELIGDAPREPLDHTDGRSGGSLERVTIDGETYVLKHLDARSDWVMRATGDVTGRALTLWRSGWLDRLPASVDHATVGAAWEDGPVGGTGALLLREVGDHLVPPGDDEVPLLTHLDFLDHMAQLHAAFWGCDDTIGLFPLDRRFTWFGPALAERERANGATDVVPTELMPLGWEKFECRAPRAAAVVRPLIDDPTPLLASLSTTPMTLVHGDLKAGNLGRHPDGRTILLDWAVTGVAPAAADLAWYVGLNRARLPQSKVETFTVYRRAIERHGVDTAPWWDRQLSLCLLGTLMLIGWEKALGESDDAAEELAWWEDRAVAGALYL